MFQGLPNCPLWSVYERLIPFIALTSENPNIPGSLVFSFVACPISGNKTLKWPGVVSTSNLLEVR